MTQVQTIGGLKRGRGRGRGRGTGRGRGGRGGRSDKPATFEPFKGPANSLAAHSNQQQPTANHGSGVFADEHQHLAGVPKLQQQHDEAVAFRAVQMAELQKQQQTQPPTSSSCASEAPATFAAAPEQLPLISSAAGSSTIDLCDEDDTSQTDQQASTASRPPAKPREQISWSLGVARPTSSSSVPSVSSNADNPFWCPARYIPVGGEAQADLRLQTHEIVQVLDSGLVGHRGTAVLDTGMSYALHTNPPCNSADKAMMPCHVPRDHREIECTTGCKMSVCVDYAAVQHMSTTAEESLHCRQCWVHSNNQKFCKAAGSPRHAWQSYSGILSHNQGARCGGGSL